MKDVEEKKIKITDEEKKKVEDGIVKLREVKDSEDLEAIKAASETLTNDAQAIGVKLYQQEQENNKEATDSSKKEEPTTGTEDAEGPVEGEVVDDKKE